MNHRASLLSLVAAVALAAACGGEAEPPASAPANPPPSAAPAETAPPVATVAPTATAPSAAPTEAPPPSQPGPGDWDKWSHEQKLAWMKAGVLPKMGALFHDYDPAKYADPKCGLCHGAGAKDGSFKMPNPDLPKLPTTPAGFKQLASKHAKIFAFMKDKVEPQMAGLLGEPPFDPKTGQGFGCYGCHTKAP